MRDSVLITKLRAGGQEVPACRATLVDPRGRADRAAFTQRHVDSLQLAGAGRAEQQFGGPATELGMGDGDAGETVSSAPTG